MGRRANELALSAAAVSIAIATGAAAASRAATATAQEAPALVGVWLPGERAVPDPLPLLPRREPANAPAPISDGVAADAPTVEIPTASDAVAADVPAAESPVILCVAPGMPALLDTIDALEIAQRGDHLELHYREWGTMRIVYTNPRNGPPTQEPSPLGVSFGRWEGTTLAIFTTYIAYPYFDRAGTTPQSPAVTVLERYTPSADRTRLEWKITVTDAATFAKPVVIAGAMARSAGAPLVASECVR